MKTPWKVALGAFCAVLGVLLGTFLYRAAQPPYRSALQPHESSFAERMKVVTGTGSLSVNYISHPTLSGNSSRFSYWTGAMARGKHPITPPTSVVATAQLGLVEVEVKSESREPGQAELAQTVASHIDTATSMFWPKERIPVAVELHQVPANSHFEFARKISWREGRPFHLTLFINQTDEAQQQAGIAVHELYHVLTTRWRLGGKSERGMAAPWLGTLFEEITASLLADCSRLQLTGRLAVPEIKTTFNLFWEGEEKTTYTSSLDARGLGHLLDPARAGKFEFTPGLLNDLLRSTAQLSLQPEDGVFVAGSDSAGQLLALCHAAIADPWYLEGWFQELIERDRSH